MFQFLDQPFLKKIDTKCIFNSSGTDKRSNLLNPGQTDSTFYSTPFNIVEFGKMNAFGHLLNEVNDSEGC